MAEHSADPDWNRDGLQAARARMVSLFTQRFGYTEIDTVGMNPTAAELLDALDEFCRSPDRRGEDILAVYFTGHGDRLDRTGEHVLVTADTRPDRLHRATPTREIAKVILYETRIRRLLLMLDTCHSGKGGADFAAAALSSYLDHWGRDEPGSGIVVLSSTQPRQLAQAGLFPSLFTAAADSYAPAGFGPESVSVDALVAEMRKAAVDPDRQSIVCDSIRVTAGEPPFLHNPRYSPRMRGIDLAEQQAREWEAHAQRREIEYRTRLLVRAMGDHDGTAWWFCGRRTALTEIADWLAHPDTTRPLLAVTGDPGSGKTAVLGLIASLTHADYRRTVPVHALDLPAEAVPGVGVVDVVIYAQNLTVDQVRDGIAAAAHLPVDTVGDLAEALSRRGAVLTVLLDGLDEAVDPSGLIRELLRPLLFNAGSWFRLLVGTRPYLLESLGITREMSLDLDAPRYADLTALTAYAVRGLVHSDPNTVYLHQPSTVIRAVAAVVAEQAAPSFLVARIVAATLSADPNVPDPTDPRWQAGLPAHAGDAMLHDLNSRLLHKSDLARDLLRPLAFAQGQGLPWEDLWAPIASALANVAYTDHDLMWLRRTAGSYVVEAIENGRSAYRLYHKALAEHLAHDHDPTAVHATFHRVLHRGVPIDADGHRDWARAHPYTLTHLATHAAHAGLIEELITDADYLTYADPDPLLDALTEVRGGNAVLTRAVYRCSLASHRRVPPERRRQILAIDAARLRAAGHLHQLNRRLEWQVRWATGTLTHPAQHATLTGHTGRVERVMCSDVGGRLIAATASGDGTVRVWDLRTSTELAVLAVQHSKIRRVAYCEVYGHPVAVTIDYPRSFDHGVARVWDLLTGTEYGVLDSRLSEWGTEVACSEVDGRPVAIVATVQGLQVWDLRTGAKLAAHNRRTHRIQSVACSEVDGRPVVVTAGGDDTVRVWDLRTGAELAVLSGRLGSVREVACIGLDGLPVVATFGYDHTVRVWDLRAGAELAVLGKRADRIAAVTYAGLDGQPVAVTVGYDRLVRVWDLRTGAGLAVLVGHTGSVNAVACTELDGRLVAVTASSDRSVRVWDLRAGAELAVLTGHTGSVNAVACTELDRRSVAVTTSSDGTVRVWDLGASRDGGSTTSHGRVTALAVASRSAEPSVLVTGSSDGRVGVRDLRTGIELAVLTTHANSVRAVACTALDERPVAVSVGSDGTVRIWDLRTRKQLGVLASNVLGHSKTVRAVACATLDGRPIAVTGGEDHLVRVWDLRTGTEYGVLAGHTEWVIAVACTNIDGRPVVVTGSVDYTVRVWDLRTGTEHAVLTGHTSDVTAVACIDLDGRAVAVTASSDHTIRVWDLRTHTERTVLEGHTGWVLAVACIDLDGRPVAVTASSDHTIRVWDLRLQSAIAVIDCPVPPTYLAAGAEGEIIVVLTDDIVVFDHGTAAQS
ncbi:caspase family protein [Nocardia takedensis]